MEEKNLISLISGGDKKAFEHLYKLYSDKVYNTAISYTQNREDAEEITQSVFTKVFQKASTFKAASSLSTWIYRITVNTSLNFIKQKTRHKTLPLDQQFLEKTDFQHPGVLLENKEKAILLYKEIDQLVDSQKTAFILSYIEGLSRKEVAEIMKSSLKAVESLLQRAKHNLRKRLEKHVEKRRKT